MARLVNLNVERSKHLERFIPFLQRYQPDVACLQELVSSDIPLIQSRTGLHHAHFAAMSRHPDTESGCHFGVGIFARTVFARTDTVVYAGNGDCASTLDRTSAETRVETCRFAAAVAGLKLEELDLTIATTHFPWTPDGLPRPFQYEAVDNLMARLGQGPLVLTGDFNAPRGGPIFDALAAHWNDCIPTHLETSLDPALHRAGPLRLMVDGLFATKHYRLSDIEMHSGVSDHQAITATVQAAQKAGVGSAGAKPEAPPPGSEGGGADVP